MYAAEPDSREHETQCAVILSFFSSLPEGWHDVEFELSPVYEGAITKSHMPIKNVAVVHETRIAFSSKIHRDRQFHSTITMQALAQVALTVPQIPDSVGPLDALS